MLLCYFSDLACSNISFTDGAFFVSGEPLELMLVANLEESFTVGGQIKWVAMAAHGAEAIVERMRIYRRGIYIRIRNFALSRHTIALIGCIAVHGAVCGVQHGLSIRAESLLPYDIALVAIQQEAEFARSGLSRDFIAAVTIVYHTLCALHV